MASRLRLLTLALAGALTVASFPRLLALALAVVLACGAAAGCRPAADPLQQKGPASLREAQRYVLALVNRDREEAGLQAVQWDEPAARAAQSHVEDMVEAGFTGHWGSDGSIPEQRYTRAGGQDFVQENAACFFDGVPRKLDPNPIFDRAELDKIESAFINEVPPNDGHRKNILTPTHNHLGVGLAKTVGFEQPCMAQEFVGRYGTYSPLRAEASVGASIRVEGELVDTVQFGGVGLARVEAQQPVPVEQLLKRGTYHVPKPYVIYFPPGFETPKPVQVDGQHFSIEFKLNDQGRPGRYEVSVWGKHPGSDALTMVSLRTILVR